jgi:hypothetical protein
VSDRPEIVCICGSARFVDEMGAVNRELTFAGVIVVAPGSSSAPRIAKQTRSSPTSRRPHWASFICARSTWLTVFWSSTPAGTSASPRAGRSPTPALQASRSRSPIRSDQQEVGLGLCVRLRDGRRMRRGGDYLHRRVVHLHPTPGGAVASLHQAGDGGARDLGWVGASERGRDEGAAVGSWRGGETFRACGGAPSGLRGRGPCGVRELRATVSAGCFRGGWGR